MRKWIPALLSLALAGCSALVAQPPADFPPLPEKETQPPTSAPAPADLPSLGPAPELENKVWLNTDQPLRLGDLRGQVVLLDMWTFG